MTCWVEKQDDNFISVRWRGQYNSMWFWKLVRVRVRVRVGVKVIRLGYWILSKDVFTTFSISMPYALSIKRIFAFSLMVMCVLPGYSFCIDIFTAFYLVFQWLQANSKSKRYTSKRNSKIYSIHDSSPCSIPPYMHGAEDQSDVLFFEFICSVVFVGLSSDLMPGATSDTSSH